MFPCRAGSGNVGGFGGPAGAERGRAGLARFSSISDNAWQNCDVVHRLPGYPMLGSGARSSRPHRSGGWVGQLHGPGQPGPNFDPVSDRKLGRLLSGNSHKTVRDGRHRAGTTAIPVAAAGVFGPPPRAASRLVIGLGTGLGTGLGVGLPWARSGCQVGEPDALTRSRPGLDSSPGVRCFRINSGLRMDLGPIHARCLVKIYKKATDEDFSAAVQARDAPPAARPVSRLKSVADVAGDRLPA